MAGCASCSRCATNCGTSALPAIPTPFYGTPPACEQQSSKVFIQNFVATIKVGSAWGVPESGGTGIIFVDGLVSILVGSYIYNKNYGYFEVTAFNQDNGQVTVLNHNTGGNQPPGFQVPPCTEFIITDPPSAGGGSSGSNPTLYPYLKLDFTAPAQGAPVTLTLTNVNGLSVGKNVQIAGGTYRLNGISSATVVTVTNEGSGAPVGTSVFAQNSQNEYQYPVVMIDQNPCTNTPVPQGSILVCKNGLLQPLSGVAGGVPILQDATTGEFKVQALGIPTRTCVALVESLTLLANTAPHALRVSDTTPFVIGDILQVGSATWRFTVTAKDTFFLYGNVAPTQTATTIVPQGTSVCEADCCEANATAITTLQGQVNAIPCRGTVIPIAIPLLFSVYDPANPDWDSIGGALGEEAVLGTLLTITVPACSQYSVQAFVNVNVLPDQADNADSPLSIAMYEIEALWSGVGPPRTYGKKVFTVYGTDGTDVLNDNLPSVDHAVWGQLLSGSPRWPMMYNGGDILGWISNVAGGSTIVLSLHIKFMVGDEVYPQFIHDIKVMASGIVYVYVM